VCPLPLNFTPPVTVICVSFCLPALFYTVLRHKAEGRYTFFIVKLQRNPIRKKRKTPYWTVTVGREEEEENIVFSREMCKGKVKENTSFKFFYIQSKRKIINIFVLSHET
jgi:hypothetical protein